MIPLALLWVTVSAPCFQADPETLLKRLLGEDTADRRRAQEELVALGAPGVPSVLRALEVSGPVPEPEVVRLVRLLGSKSWKERNEAAEALVRLGRAVIPMLEAEVSGADAEASWRLRWAVSEILERAGQDESSEDLRTATLCDILGQVGDARAVAPILRLLSGGGLEKRHQLRLRASVALGQLREVMTAGQAEEAAERVREALERMQGPLEKALLLKTLGRLKVPSAVAPLSALLLDRSEKNVHLKRSCMSALAAIGQARGIRALAESLDAEEVYVRQAAGAILGDLAGDTFGFDPRASREENQPAVAKVHAWGRARYGKDWGE